MSRGWDDAAAVRDPGPENTDEILCRRVAAGDGDAFEELVERHRDRAYRLAYSIVHDASEAQDLSQEAFLRVFEKADRFDGRARFSTWFHRILVNLCLDRRRRTRWWQIGDRGLDSVRHGQDVERAAPAEQEPSVAFGRRETMSRIWHAARALSPQQRAVLSLLVQEDLSARETAAVLGCSEATVRVHLHRALVALRARVGGE